MKPRVLWLDDDIRKPALLPTVGRFKRRFEVIECECISDFYEKSRKYEWDAAILDVVNVRGENSDVFPAIVHIVKDFPEKLWFIFSGQEQITKKENDVRKNLSGTAFDRAYISKDIYVKDEDEVLLMEDIANAVMNKRQWQVENEYNKVLTIAKERLDDKDCQKHLLDILCAAAGIKPIDSHLYYNRIRVILEWMFRAARKQGLLHDKCFDKQDKINLTDASLFMAGKATLHSGVICSVAHFPALIANNVKYILEVTGGASHTTEVEDKDIINLTSYWKDIETPYLLYSLAYMLCDVLIWFDTYSSDHPDIEANKRLWMPLDLNDSDRREDYLTELLDSYKGYVGVVEQDAGGNFHVGECLLPYTSHPPVGYDIRIVKVVENEKQNKDTYPIFSSRFELIR